MQVDLEKGAENLLVVLAQDMDARAALEELRLWWTKWAKKQQASAPAQEQMTSLIATAGSIQTGTNCCRF